jgi:hypothetical protein
MVPTTQLPAAYWSPISTLQKEPGFVPRDAPGPGLVPARFHEFVDGAEVNAYDSQVNAYLCVYRRKTPSASEWRKTRAAAKGDPLLDAFLKGYDQSYYDWGDDPGFFAAHHLLGDVRRASWGVCRRDVRSVLKQDDLVVFFCGSQTSEAWRYYFVGFGTVAAAIGRSALWTDRSHAYYHGFYNVLARLEDGRLVQHETFHKYHRDWERRAEASYVIFDPERSSFNLVNPRHVATWDGRRLPETWATDRRTAQLERLLFIERGITRRLRTSKTGFGHAKLNLIHDGRHPRSGREVPELRAELAELL